MSVLANEGCVRAVCHPAAALFSSSTQTLDECRQSTSVWTDSTEKHFALAGPAKSAEMKGFVPEHDILSI